MAYVLAGAFMISFASVFVKLSHAGPTAAVFYRFFFAFISLLGAVLITRKTLWRGWNPLLWSIAAGVVFSFDLFFWHRSILYVGPGLATILANFQVFGLAAIGIGVMGERITLNLLISIPLSLLGLMMIVGWNWSSLEADYRLGLIYGLITAGFYTGLTLILRKGQTLPNKLTPVAQMAWVCLSGTLASSLLLWESHEAFTIPDIRTWVVLLGYGIVCSAVGWSLISTGLPRMAASVAGIVLILQPTAAFIWDILFFSRPTTLVSALGAALTLVAIYLGAVRTVR
jgi:drug/metabolite transporter (DMT)-like permease